MRVRSNEGSELVFRSYLFLKLQRFSMTIAISFTSDKTLSNIAKDLFGARCKNKCNGDEMSG